jgi:hypothetical protein
MSERAMLSEAEDRTVDVDTDRPSYIAISTSPRPRVISDLAPLGAIGEDEDTLRDVRVPWFEPPAAKGAGLRDTISGLALSITLHPLAARLRSFSLVNAFACAALALAGIAWYLSKTLPPEPVVATAAPSIPEEISAPPEPPASPSAEIPAAAPAVPAAAPAVPAAAPPGIVSKQPIDIFSLPPAPPTRAGRTKSAGKPSQRSSAPAPDPVLAKWPSGSR